MSENVFEWEGETYYPAPESSICAGCAFKDLREACLKTPYCSPYQRKDKRDIVWVKIPKNEEEKSFLFTVTLRGIGNTVEEAWDAAKEATMEQGLEFYDKVEEE